MSDEERIQKLEKRVSFLEQEFGDSLDQERFRRSVDMMAPEDADVEYKEGHYGNYAHIVGLSGDQLEHIRQRINSRDRLAFAITETASGLGVEVWDDNHRKF